MPLTVRPAFAILIVAAVSLAAPASFAREEAPDSSEAPSDPLFEKQKPLFDKLEVLEAWEITRGSPDVIIGIVDSGFDFFHPDLKEALEPGFWSNGGYHPESSMNIAHGTLVASLIGARPDNGIGMKGLAPGCRLRTGCLGTLEHMLLKLQAEWREENPDGDMAAWQAEMMKHIEELQEFGKEWVAYQMGGAAEAIRYLVDRGARVINLSALLTQSRNEEIGKAFEYAAEHDVVVVIGAGNNAREYDDYPGDAEHTVVVGASTMADERWEMEVPVMGQNIKQGSNFGKRLTVMAPAENLVVCVPHSARFYGAEDGPMGPDESEFTDAYDTMPFGATSSATPIVSSLVALIRSARPELAAPEVIEILKKGCDDIGEEGYDTYTGWGRVNYRKTLEIARDWKAAAGAEKE
jgi:subtilisin family serine protease